jgi:hypothetical protein
MEKNEAVCSICGDVLPVDDTIPGPDGPECHDCHHERILLILEREDYYGQCL